MDRVQRKRIKGAKLPPNTLCVTRGTLFGNPYLLRPKTSLDLLALRWEAVNRFRKWIYQDEQMVLRAKFVRRCERDEIEHLACWCDVSKDCHADVWLEIWNSRLEAA